MVKTALIVDDSRLARLTLKRLLTKYDIQVYEAEGVLDSEIWLSRNPLPDIVFMDIMMPEMDGYEGLARLRAEPETRALPVIMYSGDISEEARKKAREAGATGYLPKPADAGRLDHLLSALKERMRAAGTAKTKPAPAAPAQTSAAANEIKEDFNLATPAAPVSTPAVHEPVQKQTPPPQVTPTPAAMYVDTTEINRRIEALEKQIAAAQQAAQQAAMHAESVANNANSKPEISAADIERQRKDVVYLQRKVAESDKRATISIIVGGLALLIGLIAVVWQLF